MSKNTSKLHFKNFIQTSDVKTIIFTIKPYLLRNKK